ncbi:MAG TPA: phytoene desaturase family protein [Chryseosolibacter sp.]|nr:phytoene desaturase family protein [Chryseosolibacter sp.]
MKKASVIGAGFSGLAAASFLARDGFEVTVFEKNSSPGGRARKFESDGFVYDMGPSWYWMPDVFEKFFNQFGKTTSDYYSLKRLDPSYRIFFSKDEYVDMPAGIEALCKLFDDIEPGSGKNLIRFLNESKVKYDIAINHLVYKPGLSLFEFAEPSLLNGLLKLHVFQSVSQYVRKFFKDPRIIKLLEFPVLFLGATAEKTPALYTMMNYADMALGTWYPMGGMFKIVEGMTTLAQSLGVRFHFNHAIERIEMNGRGAKGLWSVDKLFLSDCIIAGADYYHVEQELLPAKFRQYSDSYWRKRVMAPSSLIFYVGINRRLNRLEHHNLFFDEDFGRHAHEIYDDPRWPTLPQFYVSCPSKTDPTVAPDGCENLFILIPVAPGLHDDEAIRERYFDMIINRIETITGENIRPHIAFKRSYAHNDFISDYNAYKGNAYGLANTLRQTANFKPSIVNKKVGNLFYTGQLTVPGPGVPPSLISGEIVAKHVIKSFNPKAQLHNEKIV